MFLRTSYFSLCLIWNECLNTHPRFNVWKPGWKQADTCKMFILFADLWLKNYPFSSIPRIRTCLWNITPSFTKVGTGVVCVLIGRMGGGTGVWIAWKNIMNSSWYAHRSRSIKVYCLKSTEFIHNFQSWFTVIRLFLFLWVVSFAQCQYFDFPNTWEATLY